MKINLKNLLFIIVIAVIIYFIYEFFVKCWIDPSKCMKVPPNPGDDPDVKAAEDDADAADKAAKEADDAAKAAEDAATEAATEADDAEDLARVPSMFLGSTDKYMNRIISREAPVPMKR